MFRFVEKPQGQGECIDEGRGIVLTRGRLAGPADREGYFVSSYVYTEPGLAFEFNTETCLGARDREGELISQRAIEYAIKEADRLRTLSAEDIARILTNVVQALEIWGLPEGSSLLPNKITVLP